MKNHNLNRIKIDSIRPARFWLAYLFAFLAFSSHSVAGLFNPETFTLANGLQVIVLPNHRAPIVKQILLYKVGSIDEPRGKSGIAHFLEHLMFKGTTNISGKELEKANEMAGADQNAGTSRDFTMYHQEISKRDLENIMRLEADRMVNLLLDPKDVETERPVILEERRMRFDNNPQALLMEAANSTFFRHHPYRVPIIGWEHEIETLSQKDARDFYNNWYAPNNAVLILAGDITLPEAKKLAEKYYGPIPKRTLPEREKLVEPDHRGIVQHIEKSSDRVLQPVYYRWYSAPNQRDNLKAAMGLTVFQQIVSNGANSLLYDDLVTKKKVASTVAAIYADSMSRGLSIMYLAIQPIPGKTLSEAEDALMNSIKAILKKGVTQEQVDKAKRRLVNDIDFIRDDSFGSAEIFAHTLGAGFTVEDVEDWKNRIEAVTLEDVNKAARAVFSQDSYLTAHLLPKSKDGETE